MSQLVLKSQTNQSLKKLIIAALEAEKRELLTAILKTKSCLSKFENKYRLPTIDFFSQNDKSLSIDEMEAIEWQGEYQTLQKIEQKLKTLEEIEICA